MTDDEMVYGICLKRIYLPACQFGAGSQRDDARV